MIILRTLILSDNLQEFIENLISKNILFSKLYAKCLMLVVPVRGHFRLIGKSLVMRFRNRSNSTIFLYS